MIVLLAIGIFVLFGILLSQSSFDLPFLNPDTNQQLLFFAALSAVIFLLFVALTFVLARNLLKLFAERRLGVLGSKFRTRLVVGGLLLSFLPVIMMFFFAYGLMNRSIDKWFSRPVEEVREDTAAMASLLSRYLAQNARAEAESIAALPETQRAFAGHSFSTVMSEFRRHEPTLQGGFAVAIEDGLITPVVRSADQKSLSQIANEVRELAARARSRKLRPEEYTGATFSISNLGMFGIDEFTAVINPPEGGILAVGAVTPKPVVRENEIVIKQMMRVTMSCDHRVIDGATGAKFLQTFKKILENPLYLVV